MKRFFKFLIFCLSLGGILCVVGVGGLIGLFYYFGAGLPDYQQLKVYEPPVVTRLYANDGRLFGEYASEKRVFIPIKTIPERVKSAFLSSEDKNFYSHPGIDIFGIVRATLLNVHKFFQKRRLVGASTITQQVARNFLLSETSSLVSFERKIKEVILSFRIEHAYTKDHILELYLNEIYLGLRSYGVAAAAMNYFHKSLEELSIAEAAYLAALPKAPSKYHPEKNHQQALERRNWVIERMFEEGYITAHEVSVAKAEPLTLKKNQEVNSVNAGFFAEEVRRLLLAQYGEKGLYESGLCVRTTLDPELQEYANKALQHGLENYDRRHGWRGPVYALTLTAQELQNQGWLKKLKEVSPPLGRHNWLMAVVVKVEDKKALVGLETGVVGDLSLDDVKWARRWVSCDQKGPVITKVSHVLKVGDVILVERISQKDSQVPVKVSLRQIPKVSGGIVVMEPYTGRVLALAGGYSFEISQFNRATQALRQLGSAIKPFIYLAALEKGLTPSSMVLDAPIVIDLGWNLGVYRPKNYSNNFLGPLTLRRALELSRNTVTVRLVHELVGVGGVSEIGKRFGLYENLAPQLAMALGAGETTLLKLTNAYAMLLNGGKKMTPTLVERVQDRHGRTVQTGIMRQCVGCERTLWQEQDPPHLVDDRTVIVDPVQAYQIVSILEGAVQRGTSRRAQVLKRPIAGKTGTSNDFRNAFYIGFSPDLVVGTYVGFDDHSSLGDNESGARAALPLFVEFMTDALKNVPPTPFRIPPGTTLIRVNPYTGKRGSEQDQAVIWEAFMQETSPENSGTAQASFPRDHPGSNALGSGGFY